MITSCKYVSPLDDWHCPTEALPGDQWCILHVPDINKDPRRVQAAISQQLDSKGILFLHFDGAIFPAGISFEEVVFDRSVSFALAQFHGRGVSFIRTQFFGRYTSFVKTQFYNQETSFRGALFRSHMTSFAEAQFRGSHISFREAQFHGQTTAFQRTHFGGRQTSFNHAQFHAEETSFYEARFRSQRTSFRQIACDGRQILFRKTKFEGQQVSFRDAHFCCQRTLFHNTEFAAKETSFANVHFQDRETSFQRAKFLSQQTRFLHTRFTSPHTSFVDASCFGQVIFRGATPQQVFLEGAVDFRRISLGQYGEVVFDWADLSRACFLDADLVRVKFLDVTWGIAVRDRYFLWRRRGWRARVYDESVWRQARRQPDAQRAEVDAAHLPSLGRLYRALEAYYRAAGQPSLAGHFYYGFRDIQWHQYPLQAALTWRQRWQRFWRRWGIREVAARYIAGYGQDYAWAGGVLVSLLVLWAALYWYLGVPAEASDLPAWQQGLHAFLYSVQAGTVGRVTFYPPASLLVRYFHLAEAFCIPAQGLVFFVALYHRLRR